MPFSRGRPPHQLQFYNLQTVKPGALQRIGFVVTVVQAAAESAI
jgi:hypothetical protein